MSKNPYLKNDFEESKAAKQNRFEELAKNNHIRSSQLIDKSHKAVEHIPMGQPILVGHHSEKRHRRDLDRSWNKLDQAVQTEQKAKYYERRAQRVGTAGIASDDPHALEKLREKLEVKKRAQETMKKANQQFKKGGWDAVNVISDKQKAVLKPQIESATYLTKPFEPYSLRNNNANIRKIKKRIKELEALHNLKPIDSENDDFHMFVNNGRIIIDFSCGKPSDGCRTLLKQSSFRWSSYHGHWQRKVTVNALRTADGLLIQLKNLGSCYLIHLGGSFSSQ